VREGITVKPIVVSYWTNSFYGTYVQEKLVPGLDRFGIEWDIEQAPDLGSWVANVNQRPGFLLRMMEKHKERNLLWIDADAEVLSEPVKAMYVSEEVGVSWWKATPEDGPRVYSGTLHLRNVPAVKALVVLWRDIVRSYPGVFDQEALGAALSLMARAIRVLDLPPEYCWIEPVMRPWRKDAVPVIQHFAVGRGKNLVRGGKG
jgi:hypothetical protein